MNQQNGSQVRNSHYFGHKGTKPFSDRGWTQGCAITLGLESYNGVKQGGDWLGKNCQSSMSRMYSSKSSARKRASAMIAKIPEPLARHIARTFKPVDK